MLFPIRLSDMFARHRAEHLVQKKNTMFGLGQRLPFVNGMSQTLRCEKEPRWLASRKSRGFDSSAGICTLLGIKCFQHG